MIPCMNLLSICFVRTFDFMYVVVDREAVVVFYQFTIVMRIIDMSWSFKNKHCHYSI